MKKFIKIFILFLSINISQLAISENASAQSVSFQVFYDDLSPYGNWVENPDYGYVWCPRVFGFSPYSTNGYWVLTDVGWTWVSDYSWGWAPFHYGRWYYDNSYGYVWVPGYEWGPGWVTWRRSDDYYGWAPIGPGVSINVAYSNGYNIPYNHWNFVRCNEFGRRDIHNYYIDRSKNVTIINNTTVINTTRVDNSRKTTYNPGPDRMEVQKRIGRQVNPVAIVDEKKPAQRVTKNSVQLYRPVVENDSKATKKPAPTKLLPVNEVKQQANNSNIRKDNGAINERKAKQPQQPEVVKQPVKQQPTNENNNQRNKDQQQQSIKKPVRDEHIKQPVKQEPVQQPVPQQPTKQQTPVRKSRDEQQSPQVKQQRNVQRPLQQQPERQQTQPPPVRQQKPQRQQNVNRPPVQRQPVRQQSQPVQQQRPMPQQNINREPARPIPQQQPVRQAPVQRQLSAAPKDRKG
ncbi:MAG: DUF6600 domain-containing protein [Ferruginibacter sp.]